MLKVRITYDLVAFNEIIIEPSTLRYPTPALITISFKFIISAIELYCSCLNLDFIYVHSVPILP